MLKTDSTKDMNKNRGGGKYILLDPYPRPVDSIFTTADKRRLELLGDVVWHDGGPASDEHIERHLPSAIAIIGQTAMPKDRLNRTPNLRMIANVEGNFLPNIDYEECHRRNIYVTTIAPVFSQSVAEMALGLSLAASRGIVQADISVREDQECLYGEGDTEDCFLLSGKTMGLVGCGNIGKALIALLRPFRGELLVYDPWIHDSVLRQMSVEPVGLEDLFRRSRVVYILAAATTENQRFLGEKHFKLMQRGSVVVLVSRAGVVDFDALLSAAASGHIRAAIDVFPEEPIPAGHRVRQTPNTVLSAHRAGNLPEVLPEIGRMVVDDLELMSRGLAPQRTQRVSLETAIRYRSKPGLKQNKG